MNRNTVSIHEVRDVSAKKRMMCASFPLPAGAQDSSIPSGVWHNARGKRKGPEEATSPEKEDKVEGEKERKRKGL